MPGSVKDEVDEIIVLPQNINQDFWFNGHYYGCKRQILLFCDHNSRASLMSTSREYRDMVVYDSWADRPNDERAEHVTVRMHRSVLSHLLQMGNLQKMLARLAPLPAVYAQQNPNQLVLTTPSQILQNIQNQPALVNTLLNARQTQMLKAQFIVATFASVNLDVAIRNKNQAMLGLLLANRFVERTMEPLWDRELKRSVILRRTVLIVLLSVLLSVTFHWGLMATNGLGVFNFLDNFILNIDSFVVTTHPYNPLRV